ncbi:hypothetical protein H6768_04820 [Candidatus Peribacteria bacterium]|nr:hypothetical protein [Candidatus Peribacteria bacterium]
MDTKQKSMTESTLLSLIPYKDWVPDSTLSLTERVQEMQRVYFLANTLLSQMKTVLINTVTDSSHFTATNLATQKSIFD